MINIEQDFIKKAKVRYLKCKQGGLHQGQIMNFICIDPNCKNKGLICPVCQSLQHKDHQSMHLKIFLNEIHNQLGNSVRGQNQIGSIADHLRKLQSSKKEMLNVLKDTVQQIAQKVRKVQERIQEVYLSVRKSVLTQTALGTKLPHLYALLTAGKVEDQGQIEEQIRKCSQLLQYKNNKINAIDSTQKLIDEFSNISSAMSIHLSTMIPELTKLFSSLPIKVQKFAGSQQQISKTSYEFSKTKKPSNINLSQNGKRGQIEGQDMGGVLFVEKNFANENKVKIAFKITESLSDSISLGIGDPSSISSKGYKIDESDNTGLFGICSMGIVLNDFESQSFVYSKGDVIQVEWDLLEIKVTFGRRNGIQRYELYPTIAPSQVDKMTFFASLLVPGDKIEIVD